MIFQPSPVSVCQRMECDRLRGNLFFPVGTDDLFQFCRCPVCPLDCPVGFVERDLAEGAERCMPVGIERIDPVLILFFQKIVPHFPGGGVAFYEVQPVCTDHAGPGDPVTEWDLLPVCICGAVGFVQCGKVAILFFQEQLPRRGGKAGVDRDKIGIDLVLGKFFPFFRELRVVFRDFFRQNDFAPGVVSRAKRLIDQDEFPAAIPPQHGNEIPFHVRPDLGQRRDV